jgi:hypothetical protein
MPSNITLRLSDTSQSQNILHIIQTVFLFDDPLRRANRPLGEIIPALRAMREFQSLSDSSEYDRMLAHDVSGPNGLNADLLFCAFAD